MTWDLYILKHIPYRKTKGGFIINNRIISRRRFMSMCGKAALLSAGIGLSGCLEASKDRPDNQISSVPKLGGTFIEGESGKDAETLNWILAEDATSLGYIGLALDGLTTYDNKFNIINRWLKNDIQTSEDGLSYTVTIRDDLEWSDGRPVTTDDFVYTMKR